MYKAGKSDFRTPLASLLAAFVVLATGCTDPFTQGHSRISLDARSISRSISSDVTDNGFVLDSLALTVNDRSGLSVFSSTNPEAGPNTVDLVRGESYTLVLSAAVSRLQPAMNFTWTKTLGFEVPQTGDLSLTITISRAVKAANAPAQATMGTQVDLSGVVSLVADQDVSGLVWTSDNPALATVDASGLVSVLGSTGTVTIQARPADLGIPILIPLSLTTSPISVTGVSILPSKLILVLGGKSASLSGIITPSNGVIDSAVWSMDTSGVVGLSDNLDNTADLSPLTLGTVTVSFTVTSLGKTLAGTSSVEVSNATPAPTASPAPTNTPAPTDTPAPTASPTPTPSPVPASLLAHLGFENDMSDLKNYLTGVVSTEGTGASTSYTGPGYSGAYFLYMSPGTSGDYAWSNGAYADFGALALGDSFSISVWVRPYSQNASYTQGVSTLFSNQQTSVPESPGFSIQLVQPSADPYINSIKVQTGNGGKSQSVQTANILSAYTWNLLTVTVHRSAGFVRIFLNGSLIHSGPVLADFAVSGNKFWMGAQPAGTAHFYGALDEFHFHSGTVSDAEALGLYGDSIQASDVSLSPRGFSLLSGGSDVISASVLPAIVSDQSVVWSMSGNDGSIGPTGVIAAGTSGTATITAQSTRTGRVNYAYLTVLDPLAGYYIAGDGSGSGGAGDYPYDYSRTASGGNGGGNDDSVPGTAYNDVIFGDGSGGGGGGSTWRASTQGLAGGGNDSIYGNAGNDIIFGDGFNGSAGDSSPNGADGGFGGGGGGGGMNNTPSGNGGSGGLLAGGGGAQTSTTPGTSLFGGNAGGSINIPVDGGPSGSVNMWGGRSAIPTYEFGWQALAVQGGSGNNSYGAGGGGGFGSLAVTQNINVNTGKSWLAGGGKGDGGNGQPGDVLPVKWQDSGGSLFSYVKGNLANIFSTQTGTLSGVGAGSDYLDGGPGSDDLFGMGGNDVFYFELNDAGSSDSDTIWDFDRLGETDYISLAIGGTVINSTQKSAILAAQTSSGADRILTFTDSGSHTVTITVKNIGRDLTLSDLY